MGCSFPGVRTTKRTTIVESPRAQFKHEARAVKSIRKSLGRNSGNIPWVPGPKRLRVAPFGGELAGSIRRNGGAIAKREDPGTQAMLEVGELKSISVRLQQRAAPATIRMAASF